MNLFNYVENIYEIDPRQRLVLKALLAQEPKNEEIFLKWASLVDFDVLDYTSFRMVPAMFDCFREIKEKNPHYGRMKGIYRYFLYRNSMLFSEGKKIIKRFIEVGIDLLLFKGLALYLKYYQNPALRPMGDIDVLVHKKDLEKAEKILVELGWKYRYTNDRKVRDIHSFDYINAANQGFDLHWYALYENPIPEIDRGIWERAQTFNWEGMKVKVMAPEDLILTGVINGIRDSTPMRYEWIYDAIKIIKKEPFSQWPIVLKESQNRGLGEILFYALNLVHDISQEAVPREILAMILDSDAALSNRILHSMISEGRSHGINHKIKSAIKNTDQDGLDYYPYKHLRYFLNDRGEISLLYLQFKYLHVIKEVFEIFNSSALEEILNKYSKTGEGYVKLSPGVIRRKINLQLPKYKASMEVLNFSHNNYFLPGEAIKVKVRIANNSDCCWYIHNESDSFYGLSYHIYSRDRALIAWDFPRNYFLKPKNDYVVFIYPTQKMETEIEIKAPIEPGSYFIQFDLVHEHITWFSIHGNSFPGIHIQVVSKK